MTWAHRQSFLKSYALPVALIARTSRCWGRGDPSHTEYKAETALAGLATTKLIKAISPHAAKNEQFVHVGRPSSGTALETSGLCRRHFTPSVRIEIVPQSGSSVSRAANSDKMLTGPSRHIAP